jgi:L-aminopeptidase/D-esterase-like protein
MLGCKDSHQLANTLQQNYQTIFPNETVQDEAVTKTIIGIVNTDSRLSESCSVRI